MGFHSRDVQCSSRCYCCVSPVDAALSTASLCLQVRLGPAPHGVGEKQEPPPPLLQVPLWKNRFSARAVHSYLSSFTHLPREHFRHARLCRRHQWLRTRQAQVCPGRADHRVNKSSDRPILPLHWGKPQPAFPERLTRFCRGNSFWVCKFCGSEDRKTLNS